MRRLQVVFAVTAVGCVSTHPTPKAQAVRITMNRDAVKDCAMFGVIEASDDMTGGATVAQTPNEPPIYRRLRAEAGRLGANTVLLSDIPKTTSTGGDMQVQLRGEAYKCERT
ncbi:MAG: DUF4156 domain-containing protein [Gemmatimonadaceae bacterium]